MEGMEVRLSREGEVGLVGVDEPDPDFLCRHLVKREGMVMG